MGNAAQQPGQRRDSGQPAGPVEPAQRGEMGKSGKTDVRDMAGAGSKAGFAEFAWIWNRVLGQSLPGHHHAMADWLAGCWQSGRRDMVLMAFRNSGKSTLVGLFCAWLLYRDADLRILVLAADLDLAKKMVRNVRRVIERHPLTTGLVPGGAADWGTEHFTIRRPGVLRDPSMQAVGIGGNITGSRADMVICDDVEIPKNSDTAHKRAELREKLTEISYVLCPGGGQLYVGTPHSYYSIYADEIRPETGEAAPFLAGFERFSLPIVDGNGVLAWPERFDAARIATMRARTPARKFQSQMMLEYVAPMAGILDPGRILAYDDDVVMERANGSLRLSIGNRQMVACACHFDPSFGAAGGDGAVIACVYICERGEYWLHGVRWLRFDPQKLPQQDEASQICAQVAEFLRDYHVPSIRLETNGIGRFLPNILRRALRAAGWAASVIEHHETMAKDSRIEDAFGAVLSAGLFHAHRGIWDTPFIREMREWQPGSGAGGMGANGYGGSGHGRNGRQPGGRRGHHDDGLDAVAGCLIHEPVRLPRVEPALRNADWRRNAGVFNADCHFVP